VLEFANKQLLLLFREYVVCYVTTFDEDAGHCAKFVRNGLINEIKIARLRQVRTIFPETDRQSATNKRLPAFVSLIQQLKKTLSF
jgi:hypothetical protein